MVWAIQTGRIGAPPPDAEITAQKCALTDDHNHALYCTHLWFIQRSHIYSYKDSINQARLPRSRESATATASQTVTVAVPAESLEVLLNVPRLIH